MVVSVELVLSVGSAGVSGVTAVEWGEPRPFSPQGATVNFRTPSRRRTLPRRFHSAKLRQPLPGERSFQFEVPDLSELQLPTVGGVAPLRTICCTRSCSISPCSSACSSLLPMMLLRSIR